MDIILKIVHLEVSTVLKTIPQWISHYQPSYFLFWSRIGDHFLGGLLTNKSEFSHTFSSDIIVSFGVNCIFAFEEEPLN